MSSTPPGSTPPGNPSATDEDDDAAILAALDEQSENQDAGTADDADITSVPSSGSPPSSSPSPASSAPPSPPTMRSQRSPSDATSNAPLSSSKQKKADKKRNKKDQGKKAMSLGSDAAGPDSGPPNPAPPATPPPQGAQAAGPPPLPQPDTATQVAPEPRKPPTPVDPEQQAQIQALQEQLARDQEAERRRQEAEKKEMERKDSVEKVVNTALADFLRDFCSAPDGSRHEDLQTFQSRITRIATRAGNENHPELETRLVSSNRSLKRIVRANPGETLLRELQSALKGATTKTLATILGDFITDHPQLTPRNRRTDTTMSTSPDSTRPADNTPDLDQGDPAEPAPPKKVIRKATVTEETSVETTAADKRKPSFLKRHRNKLAIAVACVAAMGLLYGGYTQWDKLKPNFTGAGPAAATLTVTATPPAPPPPTTPSPAPTSTQNATPAQPTATTPSPAPVNACVTMTSDALTKYTGQANAWDPQYALGEQKDPTHFRNLIDDQIGKPFINCDASGKPFGNAELDREFVENNVKYHDVSKCQVCSSLPAPCSPACKDGNVCKNLGGQYVCVQGS